MKNPEIEALALLENLRIMNPNDDYILRCASALVAKVFGYSNRAEWTEILNDSGLVHYGVVDDPEAAKANYKIIIESLS